MKLPLRIQKLILSVATCCSVAGTGFVMTWAFKDQPIPTHLAVKNDIEPQSESEPQQPVEARLDDFVQLWDRPLRQALYDPPPPQAEIKQLPPLRVELAGTIIEPPNSMAIVRTEQGRTEYKRLGDLVGPADGPAKVIEIGANEIVVERASERITLGVQTKEFR
jgi:hypothetical protein